MCLKIEWILSVVFHEIFGAAYFKCTHFSFDDYGNIKKVRCLTYIRCFFHNDQIFSLYTLHGRHNDHYDILNHQPHGCLLNCLFRRRSKKTSKLRVTGLCVGNSPGTGEFPTQMASYVENVSIWWRHHVFSLNLSVQSTTVLWSIVIPSFWTCGQADYTSMDRVNQDYMLYNLMTTFWLTLENKWKVCTWCWGHFIGNSNNISENMLPFDC